ncbi:hypothetical protein BJY52DRAFT_1299376 [Lactarius psammicola]|nr:hypothetical protein BJY52DRAFT_1299376 [Lactarius psammicola]
MSLCTLLCTFTSIVRRPLASSPFNVPGMQVSCITREFLRDTINEQLHSPVPTKVPRRVCITYLATFFSLHYVHETSICAPSSCLLRLGVHGKSLPPNPLHQNWLWFLQ